MDRTVIEDISQASAEERDSFADTIRTSLVSYNTSHVTGLSSKPLLLKIQSAGTVVGGLVGRVAWSWLFIELLWLDKNHRHQGLGSRLLSRAEDIAGREHCIGIHADTFSFQALGFYRKAGYEIFGRIDNQPPGETRYYLKKNLRTI